MNDRAAFTPDALRAAGFSGFVTFRELLDGRISTAPSAPGVYVVIRTASERPTYRGTSVGGWFKGRDPSVAAAILEAKWVDECGVLYIGKADVLQRRLREYARFGAGERVGHWGGRYIWQLADSDDLIVAWRRAPEGATARQVETELLQQFRVAYGRLPFANIASPGR